LTGANFFNLSPRHIDGHYPGKAVAMLLHMVFKVARIMAPSVIYIDEVEKVFVSDKKKAKEFGGQVGTGQQQCALSAASGTNRSNIHSYDIPLTSMHSNIHSVI
jgi:AAA+ superfamily predicted ATPase